MFDKIFLNSFVLTSLISLFYIFKNLYLAKNLLVYFKRIKIFRDFEFNFLICFYIIFLIECLFFNWFVFFNFKLNIFYLYFLLKTICFLTLLFKNNFRINFLNTFNIFKQFKLEYKVIILLFFLISLFPISDADSIYIHLNYPITYLFDDLKNLFKFAELSLFHNAETILFNSVIYKISNIGNLLNFTALIVFILTLKEKKIFSDNFLMLFFSTPLILFLLNTQKLQIFFGLLYLIIFIYFYQLKKTDHKKEIFLIISLLIFFVSGKLSYYLLSIPIFIYTLYKVKKIYLYKYYLISFLLVLLPIWIIKYKLYNNPIAPFFQNWFSNSVELQNLNDVIKMQGWRNIGFDFTKLLTYFIPEDPGKISTTTGLGFIYIILVKKLKKLEPSDYVAFFGILLVYISGQISPRFYFEAILILMYFFKDNINTLIKYILKIQQFLIILLLFGFCTISVKDMFSSNNFMKKFSNSYNEASLLNSIKTRENILVLDEGRHSIFYEKNIYPIAVKEDYNYLINLIQNKNIKFISIKNTKKIPDCLKYELVKEINYFDGTRNFVKNRKKKIKKIIEIKQNECLLK